MSTPSLRKLRLMATPSDIAADTKDMLRFLAEPAGGLTIKEQQNRAARVLGWSAHRVERLWYALTQPKAHEFESLRRATVQRALRREGRERERERISAILADVGAGDRGADDGLDLQATGSVVRTDGSDRIARGGRD